MKFQKKIKKNINKKLKKLYIYMKIIYSKNSNNNNSKGI